MVWPEGQSQKILVDLINDQTAVLSWLRYISLQIKKCSLGDLESFSIPQLRAALNLKNASVFQS